MTVAAARNDLRLAALLCGLIGLYNVVYLALTATGGPSIGPPVHAWFPDFLVFHGAARAWTEDKAAMVYDIAAFTSFQNQLYADRFGGLADFRPFLYPPTWLLMLLPLAWLVAAKAYAAFLAVTVGLATALVGRREGWAWLAIITSPAALWVVVAGQNTFLSVALFYSGMRLVERAPAAAGILLGLLTYKPQLWILIPVALLAARRWRTLFWMTGTVAAVALASLAVLGPGVWWAFWQSTRAGGSAQIANEMFVHAYTQMVTLLAAARIAGLPAVVASALQLGGAIVSLAAVWLIFRRAGPWEMRTAFLAAVTFLVSPYAMNYDLLLLMPAVVALFRAGIADGFQPSEKPILLALWVMPTVGMYANVVGVPAMPLIIVVFAILVAKRALQPATNLRRVLGPEPSA